MSYINDSSLPLMLEILHHLRLVDFFSVEVVGFICSKHQPRGHGCIEPGALWLLMSQW